ncbi:MAG: hypothetical protein DRJ03_00445 [Chloroflexi bacterium]|nr:MAG: hypothetical protein DRJ03_00445 [Chloroflexota bacterium]
MKICQKCGKAKPAREFNFANRAKRIRHKRRRECTNTMSRDHYAKNKGAYKNRARVFSDRQRRINHEEVLKYLQSHPCVDCEEANPVVLQFDHVRGTKDGDISRMATQGLSLKTLFEEMAKCDVRCANCHILRHHHEREEGR